MQEPSFIIKHAWQFGFFCFFVCLFEPRDICSFALIHGKLRHRKVKRLARDCTAQSDAVSNPAAEKVHGAGGTSKSVRLRELLPPPSVTAG